MQRLTSIKLLAAVVCTALLTTATARLRAEDDEDTEDQYRPGLVAHYTAPEQSDVVRLDERLSFVWGRRSPDRQIPPGPFAVRWEGQLFVQAPGSYRLRAFAVGKLRVMLDDQPILDAAAPKPGWLDAKPVALSPGYHHLQVAYDKTGDEARLAFYWSGPSFELEPLAARWLVHEANLTPDHRYEDGEKLARALRCAACHAIPGELPRLSAPALDHLAGNIGRDWLVSWLADSGHSAAPAPEKGTVAGAALRRMPSFGMKRDEAEAIAAYLSASGATPAAGKSSSKPDVPAKGDAAAGALLANSLGCLACHRVGPLGTDGLFGGGDLSAIARKRPPEFFARWLTHPEELNRDHRMPVFRLEPKEVADLAEYLKTLAGPGGNGEKPGRAPAPAEPSAELRDRGRTLAQTYRCAACHTLPGKPVPVASPAPLKLSGKWEQGCLGEPDSSKHRPGYHLPAERAATVRQYIETVSKLKSAAPAVDGAILLTERNCLACHARGQSPGIAARLTEFATAEPKLTEHIPFMSPPSLTDIGDKLPDAVLTEAIAATGPQRRAWLKIRMPRFPLSDEEKKAIVQYLVESDRIPTPPDHQPAKDESPAGAAASARLVTTDGFGCTSCHAIGKWTPPKAPIGATGPNLSDLAKRVRREWYDRWMRDPARIVPRMEMPAVKVPVRGVLDDNIDRQLSAVWQILNTPGFNPPAPGPLRTVRSSNLPGQGERANVLTDVIRLSGQPFVKPLVIGLPNRHNVMFDLASNQLSAWWIGDTARQRTSGKEWYWEIAGAALVSAGKKASTTGELQLASDGKTYDPVIRGQFPTEFDFFQHVPGGIQFGHRLKFGDPRSTLLRVTQVFTVLSAAKDARPEKAATGVLRRMEFDGLPPGAAVRLAALPIAPKTVAHDGRSLVLTGKLGDCEVRLREPERARFELSSGAARVTLPATNAGSCVCEFEYRTAAPVDQFVPPPQVNRSVPRIPFDLVPGYDGVRLPVTDEAMPTGLAWRSDGTLVVSSLEGRVWLGRDTDGDGLVDRLDPWSDDLGFPYGVVVSGDAVHVSTKSALLRLIDNGGAHVIRTDLLASGWGHTLDYHGWVAGPAADANGNYYLSASTQYAKNPADPLMHGTVMRLVPRQATPDDPRIYTVEPFCGGLRHAMGLAVNRKGDLFATDNQGQYKAFNELNHLVLGAHYRFFTDSKPTFQPGQEPAYRSAAVEIPHPWTRSVNGITFLYTPDALRKKLGRDVFGPFEGHLIGCEYDNRMLVRISLQRVGDTYQGAVYPFSVDPAAGAEPFQGPLACAVSPEGDLYIGNIRDSGYGGGSNTGSIVRLRATGKMPLGIAEVRAWRRGFTIDFTAPVDRRRAVDKSRYTIASYRRIATPAYGANDQDRRTETIQAIEQSDDGRRTTLSLGKLRPGFVYEFRLGNLAPAGQSFFPSEAYYTLRQVIERDAE